MTERAGSRLAAGLWFAAGLLAWIAAVVRMARGGSMKWSLALAGLACIVMGISAWTRARRADKGASQ
jgi:hypothetical protein